LGTEIAPSAGRPSGIAHRIEATSARVAGQPDPFLSSREFIEEGNDIVVGI
jgi:hypothetical protein